MSTAQKLKNRSSGTTKLVSIISGLLGFLFFISLPFLPVKQEQASFSWPQGGDLTSVTAPLISYSPQDLSMTIPISNMRRLNPGQTTVISTVPEDSKDATRRGLFVRSTDRGIDVVVRNVVPLSISNKMLRTLPRDAQLQITSDYKMTKVEVPGATDEDGEPISGQVEDDIRPMVTGIYSELQNTPAMAQAMQRAGLEVNVTVDSRFTSSPTFIKQAAMFLGVLSTIIALIALSRIDRLDGHGRSRRLLHANWWRPRPIDFVVIGVLSMWHIIGANTADDGYLLTMAEASHHSGYMANYYRWFGVPESPFGSPFYDLLALMVRVSEASIWMRLPALFAGILTWILLSREVLPRLGTLIARRAVAQWTMAGIFLVFWLTYNNGTRPEPIIAVLSLLAWVCFERAIATQRLFPAAIGTFVATLALGAGPTGLMAVAALIASLGSIIAILIRRLPTLGAPKGSPKPTTAIAVCAQLFPFLAVGTAILIGVFADQTLRTVIEAIRVRAEIGPSLPWYQEYTRYIALLDPSPDGSFARRYAVLMMFFCLVVVIASVLRNGRVPGSAQGPSSRLLLIIVGTLFLMTFTPTKWTHHFGVFAGFGAAVGALAAVAASYFVIRSKRNLVLFVGSMLFLFAFTLAGPNGWWYVSSFGVPWWDKTIQLRGIEASGVVLGIAVIVVLWGGIIGFLSDARHARAETTEELQRLDASERRSSAHLARLASAPIAVLTGLVVAFVVASLAKGAVAQYPAYSITKGNLMSFAGNTCNQAADVLVETNTNDSFLTPIGGKKLKDSLQDKDTSGFTANSIPTEIAPGEDSSQGQQASIVTQDQFNNDESTSTTSSDDSSGTVDPSGTQASQTRDGQPSAEQKKRAQEAKTSDANNSGTTGGLRSRPGVNGSYAQLPFGIDGDKVPVLGSFREGLQEPATTTTAWFKLPARAENTPLIVFSAAGPVAHYDMNGVFHYGQNLTVEFAKKGEDGEYEVIESMIPLDIGTAPEWRNMRIPMTSIPEETEVLRIVAEDLNLTPDQWLAITPPRAPIMTSLNEYVGSKAPSLLDWSIAFQFPCQRVYDHYAGIAEVPEYRISPDHWSRRVHTSVMSYGGGGSVGLAEMTTKASELPTYLNHDWQRDWGVLDRLTPFTSSNGTAPKPAEIDYEEHTRSGLWYEGPLKYTTL